MIKSQKWVSFRLDTKIVKVVCDCVRIYEWAKLQKKVQRRELWRKPHRLNVLLHIEIEVSIMSKHLSSKRWRRLVTLIRRAGKLQAEIYARINMDPFILLSIVLDNFVFNSLALLLVCNYWVKLLVKHAHNNSEKKIQWNDKKLSAKQFITMVMMMQLTRISRKIATGLTATATVTSGLGV